MGTITSTFQCVVRRLTLLKMGPLTCGCRGGTGCPNPPPPPKNYKNRVSLQYWSGSIEKSPSHKTRIQCWAIIGTPPKRNLNGVSVAGRWWPAYIGIWILPHKLKKMLSKLDPRASVKTVLIGAHLWTSLLVAHVILFVLLNHSLACINQQAGDIVTLTFMCLLSLLALFWGLRGW